MSKHTPGPWAVELIVGLPCVRSESRVISSLHIQEGIGALKGNAPLREEIAANARLIAAAPDLLEALKAYVYHFGDPGNGCLVGARAAIAKAEGRS